MLRSATLTPLSRSTLPTHQSLQPPLTVSLYPHLFPFPAHSNSKPSDASKPANTKGHRPRPTTSSSTNTSLGQRTNALPPLKPTSYTHVAELSTVPMCAPKSRWLPSYRQPGTPDTPWQPTSGDPFSLAYPLLTTSPSRHKHMYNTSIPTTARP